MDTSMYLGQNALISILSHIFFIGISFFALQSLLTEKLFKKNQIFQIRLLYILVSIAIGATVSNFFLDILNWSKQLNYLF